MEYFLITIKDRSIPETITITRSTRMSVPLFKLPTRVSNDGVIRLFSFPPNTLNDSGTSGGGGAVASPDRPSSANEALITWNLKIENVYLQEQVF